MLKVRYGKEDLLILFKTIDIPNNFQEILNDDSMIISKESLYPDNFDKKTIDSMRCFASVNIFSLNDEIVKFLSKFKIFSLINLF